MKTLVFPEIRWHFPNTQPPFVWFINDRSRSSGLTSVRFVADDTLICCDYNERKMYLARFDKKSLKILDSRYTVIHDGSPVQTDLMDVKGNLVVVTNFYQGSLSFYQIRNKKLLFSHELNTNNFVNIHGVRFVPGVDDLIWVTYCGVNNKCWELVNYKAGTLIHRVSTPEQMQDVAFIGPYVLACARTNHITPDGVPPCRMYSTVYLYRMPDDIYLTEPELIDTWHGEGHLDAMIEHEGQAYAANQYCDRIDVFSVQNDRVQLDRTIEGFSMPHGIDIRADGLMAVTNYLDNSLRLRPCKE